MDTTILIEALFKTRRRRLSARAKIIEFSKSVLPAYAIKEMSLGALANIIWLHNRLAETGSVSKTYKAMAANIRRPNRVTTSLEALQAAGESIAGMVLGNARTPKETDELHAQMLALSLRRIIQNGWRDRRKVTTDVDGELGCFPESGPYFDERLRMILQSRTGCNKGEDCHYAPNLRKRSTELVALIGSIKNSTRPEDNRRRAALHMLRNTPNRKFEDIDCRKLGDAYFALHCPKDATILTSNYKDHLLLAGALGISVTEYKYGSE